MNPKKNIVAIFFLALVVVLFFWKVVFKGLVPFPGDMLVGAYYPWLDYKWGTTTGVAIKNPYITDAFSQIYIWKQLIADSYSHFDWPLWNPYSYSGYPLLANFQSGALNVFNFIFVIFGMVRGWSVFLILGIFLSALNMYFYLNIIKNSKTASAIGAIIYAFSGFTVLWMMYANADYAMAVIPLILFLIEKFVRQNKLFYLYLISPCLFFLATAGHFQILIYAYILVFSYLIYRLPTTFRRLSPKLILIGLPFIFGILFSAIQIIPTLELSLHSIRFDEGFISQNNYGLSPVGKLVTLFAPDFYGNPSTYNYWGFFNYHETNFYISILGLIALVWSLFNYKSLKINKFFLITALITLALGFDTIFGRLIYFFHVPILSTSAAGRIASIFTLSTAIISANFITNFSSAKQKQLLKPLVSISLFALTILIIIVTIPRIFPLDPQLTTNLKIAFRNLVIPCLIFAATSICLVALHFKIKIFSLAVVAILIFDLFRFGWKNTPFVPATYVFPSTPAIDFLKSDPDLFRVDRGYGPLMPPNTWAAYNLMSPSGYDPLVPKDYVSQYNKVLNQDLSTNSTFSRYSELFAYEPKPLGSFNVKYLMLPKNKDPNNLYDSKFNPKIWQIAYDAPGMTIFKNPDFQPRINFVDSPTSLSSIVSYSPNQINIKVSNPNPNAKLIIRDSFYPGWSAKFNYHYLPVDKFQDTFRSINVPAGDGELTLSYQPQSFFWGTNITAVSFIVWLMFLAIIKSKRFDRR